MESPPIAFDIAKNSSAYAVGTNNGEIVVRTFQQEEEKNEDELEGIILNIENNEGRSTSKNYKYFYRGAYTKASSDEIKVPRPHNP